jgi:hypothetical protein
MKPYDYDPPRPSAGNRGIVWNLLSVVMLLGVACLAFGFVLIFTNPYSSLNPFPPPTPTADLPTATPTQAMALLPPTWTATAPPLPTETPWPTATETLPPTPTPITLTATPSLTPLPPTAPPGGYAYEVRQGSPKAIPNIYYPEQACNGMWVGGQVVDMKDNPVTGLIVRLGGRVQGLQIEENNFTLTGVALNYGRAGYEFKLGSAPIASKDALWVQLVAQNGVPLSGQVYFTTYQDCDKNLIIIDFKQVH